MKAHTVMWLLAFGVSALGPVASASGSKGSAASSSAGAPASSSTAGSSPAAGNGAEGSKSNGKGSGAGDSAPAKATLASWLDLLAAQQASQLIEQAVASHYDKKDQIVISTWPDYVHAINAGRAAQGQVDFAKQVIDGYQDLLSLSNTAAQESKCGTGSTTPEIAKPVQQRLLEEKSALNLPDVQGTSKDSLGGWLPTTFNPWLAAVQTMVGSIKSITDTFRPSVGEPSVVAVGLVNDDLYPAPSGSIAYYIPPLLSVDKNEDVESVIQLAQGLAGHMTALASSPQVAENAACKALVGKLTKSSKALLSLAQTLQPNPANGGSTADEALAEWRLLKRSGKQLKVLDIHLTAEGATDRDYQSWLPVSKRLMQSNVLARYRLFAGTDGSLLLTGTVAVFCQVVAHEGDHGSKAFGKKPTAESLCSSTQMPLPTAPPKAVASGGADTAQPRGG